jgi:tetratricopeptide (TPR) repeat protein
MKKSMKAGIRLYRTRRYEQALSEFQSVDLDPAENSELSYYLGLCYTQLEHYDKALLYLEQVVTSSDNLLQIYQSRMILGYIYTTTKRYRLARFELEQLLTSGYESAQVYAAFGYVAYMLGQTDESLEHLQKAVTLDPRNTNALNSIGFILAEKDIDPEGALSYCKNAVQLKPENSAYLDSLGWAYFKIGRFDEAKSYLRKALNLAGGNKEIASHMKAALSAEADAKRRLAEDI